MPGRLIFFIFILAIILFFIGANLGDEYKCNINFFWLKILPDIPVFFTIFVSFALGLLCSLPFIVKNKFGGKRNETKDKKPVKDDFSGSDDVPYIIPEPDEKIKQEAMSARERFFAKRRGK